MLAFRLGLVLGLLGIAGCRRDAPLEERVSTALPSASSFADAADSAESAEPALDPPLASPSTESNRMPGPHRKRLMAAVRENATCEICHEEQAKEWRGSYHQRANVEPAYRAAFAIEPSPFCRGCHAPEADALKEPPELVSALGVGCVTCHIREPGLILAALRPASSDSSRPLPHRIERSADFGMTGGCAGCHEFRFPMPGGNEDHFFMQTTRREHDRSSGAGIPCADCHMPLVSGHRSHAFAEVREESFLRDNLHVKVEQTASNLLHVTLSQPKPGHAYPTGDLFRRLEVGYALVDGKGKLLKRETVYLARHFEHIAGRPGRTLTLDNRVHDEPVTIELAPPLPPKTSADSSDSPELSWWVSYQRVATVGSGHDPTEAKIESEVRLHSGHFPWYKRASSPRSNEP